MARTCIAVLVLALLAHSAPAGAVQILNTLSGFGDGPGWQTVGDASAELSGGNTDTEDYAVALASQWTGERQRVRLIAGLDYSEASGTTTDQDQRVHLRHNYRIDRWISTLAFTQYQRNPFQDLRRRLLFGAGFRIEIDDERPNRLGVGVSAMYEVERLTNGTGEDTVRLSTFLDFRRDIADRTSAGIVAWYQPRLTDFGDWRISVLAELEVGIGGPVSVLMQGAIAQDSDPPPAVDEYDWDLNLGLRLRF